MYWKKRFLKPSKWDKNIEKIQDIDKVLANTINNKQLITIDEVDCDNNNNNKMNNQENNDSIISFNLTKSNIKNSMITNNNNEDRSLKLIELTNKDESESYDLYWFMLILISDLINFNNIYFCN